MILLVLATFCHSLDFCDIYMLFQLWTGSIIIEVVCFSLSLGDGSDCERCNNSERMTIPRIWLSQDTLTINASPYSYHFMWPSIHTEGVIISWTLIFIIKCPNINYSDTPLNKHLYETTTLEIRPLWFSPKCMCTWTLRPAYYVTKMRQLQSLDHALVVWILGKTVIWLCEPNSNRVLPLKFIACGQCKW